MADEEKLYQKAEEAFQKKNYDYAVELFGQLLAVNPNHAKGRQALRMSSMKRLQEAGKFPPSKVSVMLKGLIPFIKISLGNPDKNPTALIDNCEVFLKLDPLNVNIRLKLAAALKSAGHLDSALGELEALYDQNRDNGPVAKALGEVYTAKGMSAKAQETLQVAARLAPNDHEILRLLKQAMAMKTMDEGWSDAKGSRDMIKDKEKAAELEKDHRLLTTDADIQAEVDKLMAAVNADPENPVMTKQLKKVADLEKKRKNFEGAETALKYAIRLDKIDTTLKMKLGDLKFDRFDLKISDLQTRLKEKPDDAAAKEQLTKLTKDKLRAQIEEYKQRALEHPTDLGIRFQLGTFLYKGGMFDEAIGEFQQAVKDPKRQVESQNYLGNCFMRKKLYDMAANQFEQALTKVVASEQDKAIRYCLIDAYWQNGEHAKAMAECKKILNVDMAYKDVARKLEEIQKQIAKK
ncbi:MAG: tetratricopeptide repeat protein [Planctomycetota bacterium]|nr:tetratricopeptide repeat protein [Planctomycetota bacterium]